jgi:hypothetical protein
MKMQILKKIIVFLIIDLFIAGIAQVGITTSVGDPTSFDPFLQGWNYRKQITIDYSKVTSDLTSFPVLISITDSDLKTKAQTDGNDILFMDNIGVAQQLNHEIENYDSSTGSLVAWVNIPIVSSTADTIFYMYYGNPNCGNQQHVENTWISDFQAVWHMNNDPTNSILDSTANHNDGISQGGMIHSDLVTGKVGKCLNFDGRDDFIALSSILNGQSGTIEAWIYANAGGDYRCILTKGQSFSNDAYFMFCIHGNTGGFYSRAIGYDAGNIVCGNVNVLNAWHQVVGISDGNKWFVYIDGRLQSPIISGGYNDGEWFDSFTGDTYSIGALNRPTYRGPFDGYIDEVRVSSAIESPSWILTEYNNQNNPSRFYSIGSEVSTQPLIKPQKPSGTINGQAGTEYTYTTVTTDPQSNLYYMWNWGDGNISGWYGPFGSNIVASASHVWTTKGTYEIKVKARDERNLESDWSDPLSISIPVDQPKTPGFELVFFIGAITLAILLWNGKVFHKHQK